MNITNSIRRITNFKFKFINKAFSNISEFTMLDVGAGNNSASKLKSIFPKCKYYGLDLNRDTCYSDQDFNLMTEFYELDLTKLDYSIIPNNYFDYINMSHVIEHLHNGTEVITKLLEKLKANGRFYIEYPGKKSLKLPSMHGTLNFYDDPTHVRVYTIEEIKMVMEANNCIVLESGIRRNWFYIFLMPFRIIYTLAIGKKLQGNLFWDILGFAEYLYILKK